MEKISLQLLRNASVKLNYAGKTLLIDPVLCTKNSFMSFVERDKNLNPTVNLPIPVEEIIAEVDAILVTHTHPDHFDAIAMEVLDKNLPMFVQPCDENQIQNVGFNKVVGVNSNVNYEHISISRTNGKHGPEEILNHLGEVSGYVLKSEGCPTVYFVGDSILGPDVEESINKHNPDVIVTFSGGAIFMGETRILMNATETVRVAQLAPNAKIIAVHMEALDHCETTRAMVNAEAKKSGVLISCPLDGEIVVL